MELFDIYSSEKWQELLEILGEKSGLIMSLADPEGKLLLTSSGERNPLCARIRNKPESLKFICSQTNTAMSQEMNAIKVPVVDTCEAGMLRIAVPVISDGVVVGQVTGCGVVEDPSEIDAFYVSKQLESKESEVEELVDSVKIRSQQFAEELATEIQSQLKQICSR